MSETRKCVYCDRLAWGTDVCVDCRQMSHAMKPTLAVQEADLVNKPPHYTHGDIEPIAVIEAWGLPHHLACVVKYIARHKHKGNAKQDLEKACWYLGRYINKLEK